MNQPIPKIDLRTRNLEENPIELEPGLVLQYGDTAEQSFIIDSEMHAGRCEEIIGRAEDVVMEDGREMIALSDDDYAYLLFGGYYIGGNMIRLYVEEPNIEYEIEMEEDDERCSGCDQR